MTLPNPKFEASYARIFGEGVNMGEDADEFFYAFYKRFLQDPEVAALFVDTNLDRQVGMLKRSLFQLVSYYVVGEPTSELDRLAHIHKRVGVSGLSFDAWMQALIDTAAEYDPEFEETTELAWCWALAPGIAYMRLKLTESEAENEDENRF